MRHYNLIVTDALTWGTGITAFQAMSIALSNSSIPPRHFQHIEYIAESQLDLFIDQLGNVILRNGAEITSESESLPLEKAVVETFRNFEYEVAEMFYLIEESE